MIDFLDREFCFANAGKYIRLGYVMIFCGKTDDLSHCSTKPDESTKTIRRLMELKIMHNFDIENCPLMEKILTHEKT